MALPAILIGNNEPIAVDRAAIAARTADSRTRDYFAAAGVHLVPRDEFDLSDNTLMALPVSGGSGGVEWNWPALVRR